MVELGQHSGFAQESGFCLGPKAKLGSYGFERHPTFEFVVESLVDGAHPAFAECVDHFDMTNTLSDQRCGFQIHRSVSITTETQKDLRSASSSRNRSVTRDSGCRLATPCRARVRLRARPSTRTNHQDLMSRCRRNRSGEMLFELAQTSSTDADTTVEL